MSLYNPSITLIFAPLIKLVNISQRRKKVDLVDIAIFPTFGSLTIHMINYNLIAIACSYSIPPHNIQEKTIINIYKMPVLLGIYSPSSAQPTKNFIETKRSNQILTN